MENETQNNQAEQMTASPAEVMVAANPVLEHAAMAEAQGERPRGRGDRRGGRDRGPRRERRQEDKDGFDNKTINIRRVSRMYKGGRRMRMSSFVVVGDRAGRVGVGLGKGSDVNQSLTKANTKAKKNLMTVPLKGNTIPHEVLAKYGSSRVLIKPAAPGTGIVAGATVKAVLDLAGVKDALTKVIGSTNEVNVIYATLKALKSLRSTRL